MKAQGSDKYFTLADILDTNRMNCSSSGRGKQVRELRPAFKFSSGSVYVGEWLGKCRDGFGTQDWADGAQYQGHWVKNKAIGLGKFSHIDGDVYYGAWDNDKANGFGIYTHHNGGQYYGEL